MAIYTVHEPAETRRGDLADRIVFVKDGFSWPALFFAVPWILWHRLWWVLLGYLVLALALPLVMSPLGADHPAIIVASVLFSVLFALLANGLRRWTLGRRGYRLAAVVQGRRMEDAERRFFERWTGDPAPAPAREPPPAGARPVIGMFQGLETGR